MGCANVAWGRDIHHRWWVCPRRHALWRGALHGAAASALASLPPHTRLHGFTVELEEITEWRSSLPQDSKVPLPKSRRYCTDGSCRRPRLPEVRMAAWAVVGRSGEGWWSRAGPCPGRQTIGRAELASVVHVLLDTEPGAIITDCCGIMNTCMATQRGQSSKEAVLKGANADL
jgi:hypothetical protein